MKKADYFQWVAEVIDFKQRVVLFYFFIKICVEKALLFEIETV